VIDDDRASLMKGQIPALDGQATTQCIRQDGRTGIESVNQLSGDFLQFINIQLRRS
jgi:hypothetical protein